MLLATPAVLSTMPASADPGSVDPSAAGSSLAVQGAADRNTARWAELEAQARITDGDYDGAIQAERQADAERRKADYHQLIARPPHP
jgi:hypothetical protein